MSIDSIVFCILGISFILMACEQSSLVHICILYVPTKYFNILKLHLNQNNPNFSHCTFFWRYGYHSTIHTHIILLKKLNDLFLFLPPPSVYLCLSLSSYRNWEHVTSIFHRKYFSKKYCHLQKIKQECINSPLKNFSYQTVLDLKKWT